MAWSGRAPFSGEAQTKEHTPVTWARNQELTAASMIPGAPATYRPDEARGKKPPRPFDAFL